MYPKTIKPVVLELIREKYRIVDVIDLFDYSEDIESLAKKMEDFYDHEFAHDQRLVILHHDTDYYPNVDCVGNTIYNFFRICANFFVSLDHMIFLTNHYGIKKEITDVCTSINNTSVPNVIYTSQWYDFPNKQDTSLMPAEYVSHTHLFCCLNHRQRQHRLLTLCMLEEHGLTQQGMTSYHFDQ